MRLRKDAAAPSPIKRTRAPLDGQLAKRDLELRVAFAKQQRVVGRIDDSGQCCAAFPAIELIAFKAAGVDRGGLAATEVQPRPTFGAERRIVRRSRRKLVRHRHQLIRSCQASL